MNEPASPTLMGLSTEVRLMIYDHLFREDTLLRKPSEIRGNRDDSGNDDNRSDSVETLPFDFVNPSETLIAQDVSVFSSQTRFGGHYLHLSIFL